MQELNREISELGDNVRTLVATIAELRKNEMVFRQELVDLKNQNDQQKEKIKFLEEKNKMMNLASSIDPGIRADLKTKIRDLVREIDGCIAILKD